MAQPSVSSKLAKDSILIGEQVNYSIIIQSDKALRSIVPNADLLQSGGIEIIKESIDSTTADNYSYSFHYLITSFDSGIYTIPGMDILVNEGNKMDTVYSPHLSLLVYSPEVDTTAEIKDIKAPFRTPFKLSELLQYYPYIGGGLLLLAILLVVLWYLNRRQHKSLPGVILPAHIKAIQRLDNIKKEKLWQQGRVKDYYSELSVCVRQYIEERFGIPAMESVTHEILRDFKRFSYDDEYLMEILENMLNLADLVKFAKEDPAPSENETKLNQAYILVEKTKPAEEPKEDKD